MVFICLQHNGREAVFFSKSDVHIPPGWNPIPVICARRFSPLSGNRTHKVNSEINPTEAPSVWLAGSTTSPTDQLKDFGKKCLQGGGCLFHLCIMTGCAVKVDKFMSASPSLLRLPFKHRGIVWDSAVGTVLVRHQLIRTPTSGRSFVLVFHVR